MKKHPVPGGGNDSPDIARPAIFLVSCAGCAGLHDALRPLDFNPLCSRCAVELP